MTSPHSLHLRQPSVSGDMLLDALGELGPDIQVFTSSQDFIVDDTDSDRTELSIELVEYQKGNNPSAPPLQMALSPSSSLLRAASASGAGSMGALAAGNSIGGGGAESSSRHHHHHSQLQQQQLPAHLQSSSSLLNIFPPHLQSMATTDLFASLLSSSVSSSAAAPTAAEQDAVASPRKGRRNAPTQPSHLSAPSASTHAHPIPLTVHEPYLARGNTHGSVGFLISFDKHPTHITSNSMSSYWSYSESVSMLFASVDTLIPIVFRVAAPLQAGADWRIRAMIRFKSPVMMKQPVKRCPNHIAADTDPHLREYLLRCTDKNCSYEMDAQQRQSIIIPFSPKPAPLSAVLVQELQRAGVVLHTKQSSVPQGPPSSANPYMNYTMSAQFKFTCFASCQGGINKRPVEMVFTLEDASGAIYGCHTLDFRICASPSRDRRLAESAASTSPLSAVQSPSTALPPSVLLDLPLAAASPSPVTSGKLSKSHNSSTASNLPFAIPAAVALPPTKPSKKAGEAPASYQREKTSSSSSSAPSKSSLVVPVADTAALNAALPPGVLRSSTDTITTISARKRTFHESNDGAPELTQSASTSALAAHSEDDESAIYHVPVRGLANYKLVCKIVEGLNALQMVKAASGPKATASADEATHPTKRARIAAQHDGSSNGSSNGNSNAASSDEDGEGKSSSATSSMRRTRSQTASASPALKRENTHAALATAETAEFNLQDWLSEIKLSHYASHLMLGNISTLAQLLQLTDDDLAALHIRNKAHRALILRKALQLKEKLADASAQNAQLGASVQVVRCTIRRTKSMSGQQSGSPSG